MKFEVGLQRRLARCKRGLARGSASLSGALLLLSAPLATGCGDDGGGGPADPGDAVMLGDANNYTAVSNLSLPSVSVAAGQDVTLCWDQLTQDMQCHAVTPATDVDLVTLLRFDNMTKEQVAVELGIGRVGQHDLGLLVDYQPPDGSTCAQLSNLTRFGQPWDLATDFAANPSSVYVAVFARGTTPGVGAMTMVFVDPTSAETNLQVDGGDGCPTLDFQANLVGVTPVVVPAAGPFVVNWSQVTRDSTGESLPFTNIDRVLLGFYPGFTVQQLQDQILDLELLAAPMYTLELTGVQQQVDLTQATDAAGNAFTGFTRTDGVWALAVMCSSCQNPAPSILTILQPG